MPYLLANIFWPPLPELDTEKGAEHLKQSGRNMLKLAAGALGVVFLFLGGMWAVHEGSPVLAGGQTVWDYLVFVHWYASQVGFGWYLIGCYVTLETCRYLRITISMFQLSQRLDLADFDQEKLDALSESGAALFRIYVCFLLLHFFMVVFGNSWDSSTWWDLGGLLCGAPALLAPFMLGGLLLPSEIKQLDTEGMQPQLTLYRLLENRLSIQAQDTPSGALDVEPLEAGAMEHSTPC
ncbi:hypothetical protein LC612_35330 [Nostoc sp. CHAB 5834]|nr:hypothetical protein [Nostoc sp. CHAB 5834]